MKKYSLTLFLLLFSSALIAADMDKLKSFADKMTPGTWLELPNTKIPLFQKHEIQALEKRTGSADIWGVQGSKSVLNAWNGAAFDGHRWWFFGGGHNAYGGNEVYQFDFYTLAWTRLTSPSPLTKPEKVKNKLCYMPETGPVSLHTYDSFIWNPKSQSIWFLRTNGIAYCKKSYFKKENLPFWEFKPDTRQWIKHGTHNIVTGRPMTAWNDQSKRVVVVSKDYSSKSRGPFEIDENGDIHRKGNIKFGVVTGNMIYNPRDRALYATFKVALKKQSISYPGKLGNFQMVAKFPQAMIDDGIRESGMAIADNKLTFWTGKRTIWTWDFEQKTFQKYSNQSSPRAPDGNNLVFSKWIYIAEAGVFAGLNSPHTGIWLYKPGGKAEAITAGTPRACVNNSCTYSSIAKACSNAKNGDTIKLLPGNWHEQCIIKANNITLTGNNKAILSRVRTNKAAIIIKGNNSLVKDLECYGIKVPDGNGACIRLEGKNLTLKNVYFHHNQEGLLSGNKAGTIIIEDSRFEYNGKEAIPKGRSHGLYVSGKKLKIINSKIIGTTNEGHQVKSRASETIIRNSTIASINSQDSRLIDIPNGGILVIKDSILQQGKNSTNRQVIGYGWERGKRGPLWTNNEIYISNNIIILDRKKHKLTGIKGNIVTPIIKNNVIIGANKEFSNNCHFASRASANIAPYPEVNIQKRTCP